MWVRKSKYVQPLLIKHLHLFYKNRKIKTSLLGVKQLFNFKLGSRFLVGKMSDSNCKVYFDYFTYWVLTNTIWEWIGYDERIYNSVQVFHRDIDLNVKVPYLATLMLWKCTLPYFCKPCEKTHYISSVFTPKNYREIFTTIKSMDFFSKYKTFALFTFLFCINFRIKWNMYQWHLS